jgi:hypothetical protein
LPALLCPVSAAKPGHESPEGNREAGALCPDVFL